MSFIITYQSTGHRGHHISPPCFPPRPYPPGCTPTHNGNETPTTTSSPSPVENYIDRRQYLSPKPVHYSPSPSPPASMDPYYGAYGESAQQPSQPAGYRPTKPEDWEPYRDIIAHLYNTCNMKLKDVMVEMQSSYGFKATEKQYKTQLKKWNLDTKYIKGSEYMFMIKTMRERQAENPPKETRFILRGRVVDPKDIARFEKRAQKKGLLKDGQPIVCDEPVDDLVCCTPPPEEIAYHQAAYVEAYTNYQYDPGNDYGYSY